MYKKSETFRKGEGLQQTQQALVECKPDEL
jgi:hypothetical protein